MARSIGAKKQLRLLGLPDNYRLVQESSGHWSIRDERGDPLRTADGIPIQVSRSAADYRTLENERARIRKALRLKQGGGE